MNEVIMIGRMASDPEIRTTQSGKSVCTFRIAVNRPRKNADGVREADFFPVVAWDKSGEYVHKYAPKGREIAVEGHLQTRSYDAQDGSKRYVTEIVAETVQLLGAKTEGNTPAQDKPARKGEFTEIEDDNLPF